VVEERAARWNSFGFVWPKEKPDVVHLACHGTLKPQPALLLQDEFGDRSPTSTQDLLRGLAGQKPRLLFLSACQTAMTDDVVSSLVWSLMQAPAILGWLARSGTMKPRSSPGFFIAGLPRVSP
jgi:CHAT domain-containing protein